jgi:demethylmenaquinone methyltransferase/2-methoxy-6-polyprenyl-1,4-benzoquinol methylase
MHKSALRSAFDGPAAKRAYVRRLFATIAGRYDVITRVLSFGRDRGWKRRLLDLANVAPGARVLDLACGTGDLAFDAAERGGRVIGLDITPAMIDLARAKPGADDIAWLVGDMTALPAADASIDLVTTGYGLRNVPNLEAALREIRRVLRPGGVACSLDFDRPEARWLRAVYLGYLTAVGSALGWLLHRDSETYRYIPASIRRYPGARRVADMMRAVGFRDVEVVPVFGGLMAIHRLRK